MVYKYITIPEALDQTIQQVIRAESTKTSTVSYSKTLAYLLVLGVDRYRGLRKENEKIDMVEFDFTTRNRKTQPIRKLNQVIK